MDKWKKCKVVMIPAEKEENFTTQHLYIISNDLIQKGNWFINISDEADFNKPEQLILLQSEKSYNIVKYPYLKKVIASTDPSLNLPYPSQAFVKKYCEVGGIDEIMVKYEEITLIDPPSGWKYGFPKEFKPLEGQTYKEFCLANGYPESECFDNMFFRFIEMERLAVTKKNQVSIRKVKDTWSRKEVNELLHEFVEYVPKSDDNTLEGEEVRNIITNFLKTK